MKQTAWRKIQGRVVQEAEKVPPLPPPPRYMSRHQERNDSTTPKTKTNTLSPTYNQIWWCYACVKSSREEKEWWLIIDPSKVFSTFDWHQLAKNRQHGLMEIPLRPIKIPILKVSCWKLTKMKLLKVMQSTVCVVGASSFPHHTNKCTISRLCGEILISLSLDESPLNLFW